MFFHIRKADCSDFVSFVVLAISYLENAERKAIPRRLKTFFEEG